LDKRAGIKEILRVAHGSDSLSQSEFEGRAAIGLTTVRDSFGTWNQAVEAAGLLPIPPGSSLSRRKQISDEEYLLEIVRLTREIGRAVTMSEMNAKGRFSVRPYVARWRSFARAREAAYELYGTPDRQAPPEPQE
jgi:hypothetical protein